MLSRLSEWCWMTRERARDSRLSSLKMRFVSFLPLPNVLHLLIRYEQASAQASLTVNNQELKKRRISVTIAQARAVGMAKYVIFPSYPGSDNNALSYSREKDLPREARIDVISRIVRVGGLTPGTEEAVVQQAFENIGPVKFVTMEAGSTDALIEFEEATVRLLPLISMTRTDPAMDA